MKSCNIVQLWKFPLLLGVVLSLLYLHYFENQAQVELDISVTETTMFNIYWADADQGYSQWKRARVRVTPDQRKYSFGLTDLRKIAKLRIDTHQYEGKVVLHSLVLSQNGYLPLQFKSKKDFKQLAPLFDITSTRFQDSGLEVHSSGKDPQLQLFITLQKGQSRGLLIFLRIAAIFFVVCLFFYFSRSFRYEKQFIPILFSAVFVLIVVMAAISRENVHPDEYVHLDAGIYYKTKWLPPVVDDPAIQDTYSVYGVSRLNSREVSYLFTGKLAELVSSLRISDLLGLRLFNVLLWGLLLLYFLKNIELRFMAAPLLISPQFWYVFSYCNSDAFALALSSVVACQAAFPQSLLNSFLLGEGKKRSTLIFMVLGGFCSLLFLLKKNYLLFVIFLIGYLLWRLLFRINVNKRRQYLKRLTAIILLGMSLTGLRIGADYAINGMDRSARIQQIREELASPLYKPSTPLELQHSFLNRRARGDTLKTIIVVDRWFEKTYRSAFGMYGYFTAVGTDAYYGAVRAVGVALFVLLSVGIIIRGGVSRNLLFGWFLVCSAGLIGVSLWHSWTTDYQTQGRYLFPIVPMACVLLYHVRQLMQGAVYKLLLTAMFMLSVYSFVFVALMDLPKT